MEVVTDFDISWLQQFCKIPKYNDPPFQRIYM